MVRTRISFPFITADSLMHRRALFGTSRCTSEYLRSITLLAQTTQIQPLLGPGTPTVRVTATTGDSLVLCLTLRRAGFHLIKLVTSRDLTNWTYVGNRSVFIEPSHVESGAYDTTQMLGPSDVIVRGDELWMFYTGIKYR